MNSPHSRHGVGMRSGHSFVVAVVRPVLAVVLLGLTLWLPLSPMGLAYTLAFGLWMVGRPGFRAGAFALASLTAATGTLLGYGSALAHEGGAAWIDENDVAVPVATLLPVVEPDAVGLRRTMGAGYARMREDAGVVGTPMFGSWLGNDARLEMRAEGKLGVVFLHGWAGNFALPCWHVAIAAREVGGSTICPSAGFHARWTDHETRVRRAIEELRAEGAERIVLAGISAGGVGASRLAPRLRGEIDGVLLIAGVSGRGGPPRVPVLTIGGRADGMTSPAALRRYGRRHGRHVSLRGGHFALLEEHELAHREMTEFLRRISERPRRRATRGAARRPRRGRAHETHPDRPRAQPAPL